MFSTRLFSIFAFFAITFFALDVHAGVRVINGTSDLSIVDTLVCAGGMSCSKVNGKVQLTTSGAGSVRPRIAATATTATLAQCGSTFYNTGAVVVTLPLASSVLGCHYRFITLNATNFDVRANAADQILVLTTGVGRAARNATLGSTLTVEACGSGQWCDVAEKGTWADTP